MIRIRCRSLVSLWGSHRSEARNTIVQVLNFLRGLKFGDEDDKLFTFIHTDSRCVRSFGLVLRRDSRM
jgi:hypothetical protein